MMSKHLQRIRQGTQHSEEIMTTLLMQPEARESLRFLLRTRGENLNTTNSCPSEIDITTLLASRSRRVRVLTLPRAGPQEQKQRQGTDFQVELEKAQHSITEMVNNHTLTIQGWAFDLIINPPGSERILLSPTHQDNNQAKFLAFITTIRELRDNGNGDTKIELILAQGLQEAWDKDYHKVTLMAVRLEPSRRVLTKRGIQWLKPPSSALGIKASEAPRIFLLLGNRDLSQTREDLQREIGEILQQKGTLRLNMVADTETSTDHIVTFGLRPCNDRPENGTQQAINRAKDRLQTEHQSLTDTSQKIITILDAIHLDTWEKTNRETCSAIRSMCGDLTAEDRPSSSQALGKAILAILAGNGVPSALNDDDTWQELIPPQRLVITVVSGIPNFRNFFATDAFKPTISTHPNKHSAQMFCIRQALQQRSVETETVEFIHEERTKSQPPSDTFIAIFTEKSWTNLIQKQGADRPTILTAIPNTMAKRLCSTEIRDVKVIDGSLKVLPGLTFKAIEEIEVEGDNDEGTLQNLLSEGHVILIPQFSATGTEIDVNTPAAEIPNPGWRALGVHNLAVKHPEKILQHLHHLREKKRAQCLTTQKEVIIWIYPPLVDLLLALGREKSLQDLLTNNDQDTNRKVILNTLTECIEKTIKLHSKGGLWLQDTPFPDATPGTAIQDGSTTPYPTSSEVLATLPDNITRLLQAPTASKCQLLMDLTSQSIRDLIKSHTITPVLKQGHTLLIQSQSDLLPALLRSDQLKVGWPINFDTLEVSNAEIEGALQKAIGIKPTNQIGWHIIRLSVSDTADYPNFDLTDFEPTTRSDNPHHICQSNSQILSAGRWIINSAALKQLKLTRGIVIFTTPQPKGILWLCPGKDDERRAEYRPISRLLGIGPENDQDTQTRIQTILRGSFTNDQILLDALLKARASLLLESLHPVVDSFPALLQDHHIVRQKDSIVEVSHCPQQTPRPHIHDGWNLLPRWPASSNPTELIYFMIAARSKNLMVNHFHLDILDIPQVGSLILTDTDSRLRATIPPKTFLNRLITALRSPPTTMVTMTAEERQYILDFQANDNDMGLGGGQQGPAAAQ
jgi:hypothetical protein